MMWPQEKKNNGGKIVGKIIEAFRIYQKKYECWDVNFLNWKKMWIVTSLGVKKRNEKKEYLEGYDNLVDLNLIFFMWAI